MEASFTNGMLPDENMKSMKTFKSKDPKSNEVSKKVLKQFITDQKTYLILLEGAKKYD